ncbi:MAG TPA: type II secretion system protein [Sulfurimonas sp.]|nr:type II secretion system protein [Sulfurimonas sp.]
MRKAYTLVELIFVIVIIGVLAGVASTSFKSDYLSADADFIVAKIKQAQYKAIGFEHKVFGSNLAPVDYNNGCINLETISLEDSAVDGKVSYKLHVDSFDEGTLCFDAKGRPHDADFTLATLRSDTKVITLSYNGQTKDILILSLSGLAIIKCN